MFAMHPASERQRAGRLEEGLETMPIPGLPAAAKQRRIGRSQLRVTPRAARRCRQWQPRTCPRSEPTLARRGRQREDAAACSARRRASPRAAPGMRAHRAQICFPATSYASSPSDDERGCRRDTLAVARVAGRDSRGRGCCTALSQDERAVFERCERGSARRASRRVVLRNHSDRATAHSNPDDHSRAVFGEARRAHTSVHSGLERRRKSRKWP